jgi:hypothetical protein
MTQPLLTFAYASSGELLVGGAPMLNFYTDWRMAPEHALPPDGDHPFPSVNFYVRKIGLTVLGGQPGNWVLIGHSGPNGDWMNTPCPSGQTMYLNFDADAAPLFTQGVGEYFDAHIGFLDPTLSLLVGFWYVPASQNDEIIYAGNLLEFGTGSSTAAGIDFAGLNATLRLDSSTSQTGEIDGGVPSDVIDLAFQSFATGDFLIWTQTSGTGGMLALNNSGGTTLWTLTLSGLYLSGDFSASSDGHGGTAISYTVPSGSTATMFLRQNPSGMLSIYNIANNTPVGLYQAGRVGLECSFLPGGFGPFNDGDTADFILRDTNTGAFQVYNVANDQVYNSASLGTVGLDWSVSGFGRFATVAGERDMMMRQNGGAFTIYDIASNQITGYHPIGAVGTDWSVLGFGNFATQANETDIMLRNSATGALEHYDIRNNSIVAAGPMGAIGTDWSVLGFGNFSSQPNETDMLMRNNNTGAVELYDISHNTITNAMAFGNIGLGMQPFGVSTLSDSTDDLLMRNVSTGAFEVYDIANNQLTGAASLGSVGLDWQLGGFAADPPTGAMGSSDGSTSQLVQAMAGFGGGSGAAISNTAPLGADTSQQQFLTTPQHA